MFAVFFGVPGPLEVLIVGLLFIVVLVVPIAVLVTLLVANRRNRNAQTENPNLQPCPDCDRYISVRAASCPHCGAPNKSA
ncbi:MAG: hypothetical protein ACC628_23300 [Pirellulaceae bacterium]